MHREHSTYDSLHSPLVDLAVTRELAVGSSEVGIYIIWKFRIPKSLPPSCLFDIIICIPVCVSVLSLTVCS